MLKRLRIILASLAVLAVLLPAVPALAATDPYQEACKGGAAQSSSLCNTNRDSIVGPNGILVKAARLVALVAGVAAVIIMVIGGFMYVASGGDPQKVNTARATVVYAAVGLVVIALAQAIIVFVMNRI